MGNNNLKETEVKKHIESDIECTLAAAEMMETLFSLVGCPTCAMAILVETVAIAYGALPKEIKGEVITMENLLGNIAGEIEDQEAAIIGLAETLQEMINVKGDKDEFANGSCDHSKKPH